MADLRTKGCALINLGREGNALLMRVHKTARRLFAAHDFAGFSKADATVRMLASALGWDTAASVEAVHAPSGRVAYTDNGTRLVLTAEPDEDWPNGYFVQLVRAVLVRMRSNTVVSWTTACVSAREDGAGAFGGQATVVTRMGVRFIHTTNIRQAAVSAAALELLGVPDVPHIRVNVTGGSVNSVECTTHGARVIVVDDSNIAAGYRRPRQRVPADWRACDHGIEIEDLIPKPRKPKKKETGHGPG